MPQYLVYVHSRQLLHRNRSDDGGDPRAEPRTDCRRRAEVRLWHFPGRQRKDGAEGNPTARCSSPTGRTSRPRSTWADFGYWKPPALRHSHGRRELPSPAMYRARCASFFLSGSEKAAGIVSLAATSGRWRLWRSIRLLPQQRPSSRVVILSRLL